MLPVNSAADFSIFQNLAHGLPINHQRWSPWAQRSRHKRNINHELSKQYYGVLLSHASLRIIVHEHVRVLDDTLLASSGSGSQSRCLQSRHKLLMLADMNSVTTNDCQK